MSSQLLITKLYAPQRRLTVVVLDLATEPTCQQISEGWWRMGRGLSYLGGGFESSAVERPLLDRAEAYSAVVGSWFVQP